MSFVRHVAFEGWPRLRRLLLAVIAPHGALDLLYKPWSVVVGMHALASGFLAIVPVLRPTVLALVSIWHLADELTIGGSLLMHGLWLVWPESCLLYLALVHTPLYYARVGTAATIAPLALVSLVIYFWGDATTRAIASRAGEFWWVAPVSAHVLLQL